ncbi:MAG TPA: ATP-binding cassette domain-containing protein [Solirubrobacteraceae bacterium]|nr:ATP-binding cassette domain-containing protein [Solirubrobacteraceae bacterium]
MRDVSMLVAPGQLAALVGPSGARETTISYLVPRLYDVECRGLTSATIAGAVGVVTQERATCSAARCARTSATAAGRDPRGGCGRREGAFIHGRITALENGYDTVVGERGYRCSGGERQRLAIARVILDDPPILILDEATSALDTESERVVQRGLEALMHAATTIAIAYRLSTTRPADAIFVIERGTIVERGTHEQLLAEGCLYARLYEEQFGDGAVEAHCSDGVILANGRACRPSSRRAPPGAEFAAHGPTEREGIAELPADLRTALTV